MEQADLFGLWGGGIDRHGAVRVALKVRDEGHERGRGIVRDDLDGGGVLFRRGSSRGGVFRLHHHVVPVPGTSASLVTDELNVALYSTVPFTVRPVFAASTSAISRKPCASTAPALVPSPHRMAVTTFPSIQSGVMVKSNVFVLVTSAGAVTPASTPMIAADIAAMHTAIRSGIAASGRSRSRSRRRIVARMPRVLCCPCGPVGIGELPVAFRRGGKVAKFVKSVRVGQPVQPQPIGREIRKDRAAKIAAIFFSLWFGEEVVIRVCPICFTFGISLFRWISRSATERGSHMFAPHDLAWLEKLPSWRWIFELEPIVI